LKKNVINNEVITLFLLEREREREREGTLREDLRFHATNAILFVDE